MFNASPIQWTGTWANSGDDDGQGSLAHRSPGVPKVRQD